MLLSVYRAFGPITRHSYEPDGAGLKTLAKFLISAFGQPSTWQAWYDNGMTRAKIAISLPKHQLARAHREVRAGRADSVSGYIASVLEEQEKRDSLRTLLRDLIEQHGEPASEDIKWAERMLPRRGRG